MFLKFLSMTHEIHIIRYGSHAICNHLVQVQINGPSENELDVRLPNWGILQPPRSTYQPTRCSNLQRNIMQSMQTFAKINVTTQF